jgi:methylase of polypeptide subunit release factors
MPTPDRAAAAVIGKALRKLDYTEDTILDLLGDDGYSSATADVLLHLRRLPADGLGHAVRLLFLGRPVDRRDAVRALGERGVDALAATRLAEVGADVAPLARIAPVHDVLLASDRFSQGTEDPPDYVAGYTPTSRLLDSLTPRPRVRRALDVGTGPGIHALLAARHAGSVVATDVNRRALAFTELNAALNGLEVETRRGSLFDPAGEEEFDLITANAPFVVSPETRWAYRDTELPGDEVSEHIVRGAAARLAPGGFAAVLVSWVAGDPDEPDERPLAWVEGTGCDAWILPTLGSDPLEHAAGWNDHLVADETAFGETVDRWEAYLDRLGARWISEGGVILHRRDGATSVRIDEVDSDELEAADAQIRRAFAARAAGLRGRDLLAARLALAPAARVEQTLKGDRVAEARVVLAEGTHPVVEIPPRLAAPIAALDGGAVPDARPADARYLRELLELGILRLLR